MLLCRMEFIDRRLLRFPPLREVLPSFSMPRSPFDQNEPHMLGVDYDGLSC